MTEMERPLSAIRLLRTFQTPTWGPTLDYLTLRPRPPRLVLPNGRYDGGWYDDFTGQFNTSTARASGWRFQRWLHVHFDTGRYFVAANVAHMSLAGNTALLILDRNTGRFYEASTTKLLWANPVEVDAQARTFHDTRTGSVIAMTDTGLRLDVRLDGLRFEATAEAIFDRPFTQITRYHGGAGTLQWWGNLSLDRGSLTLPDHNGPIDLPVGTLGAYDRTVGHRRPIQNWNWLAAVGQGRDTATDEPVVVSLIASTDQERARPRVVAHKNNVWIDGQHLKLPEMRFDYTVHDPKTWDTGPWTLTSHSSKGTLDLTFLPEYRRREQPRIPLLTDVDFNQYYGYLSGQITALGRTVAVDGMFGLVEDSWMVT